MMVSNPKIAVVQWAPKFMDRESGLEHAVKAVNQAAEGGAGLISLGEAFIPGYPEWIGRLVPNREPAIGIAEQLYGLAASQAVDVERGDLQILQEVARERKVAVSVGIQEKAGTEAAGSLFNTVVVIGDDGTVVNKHRKLTPTYEERLIWGAGDGAGLGGVETPAGRVTTRICWENYSPLNRFSAYSQNPNIYLAPTWDFGDIWIAAMRFVARESRCWVVSSGTVLRMSDIPRDLPGRDVIFADQEDDWLNPGDSVVIDPKGDVVAGPLHKEEDILYYDCAPLAVESAHRKLDVVGHYARPDIFSLTISRRAVTELG